MKYWPVVLSFFIFNAVAEDCSNCGNELKHGSEIEKQISTLSQLSAVNCSDVVNKDADEEYNRNFSKDPVKTSVVQGLKLKGSADELKFLALMLDKKPTNEWAKAKDCATVLCALGKVYDSETTAKRALNIAKRNGYIISASKDFSNEENKPIGQLFSSKEIETIDLAYKRLPPNFSKLKTMDRLRRMPDGYSSPRTPNAAAYASPGFKSSYYSRDGEIVFISTAFDSDNTWASSVVVHELSHHLDFSKSGGKEYAGYSESPEFLKLSGWKLDKSYKTENGKKVLVEKWTRPETKDFVRDYAGTQPAEDFAEAVAYYVFEPNKLRQTDPEKYNFIKSKVFAGQEYDNVLDGMISKDELVKTCFNSSEKIQLRGISKYYKDSYFKNCLSEVLTKLTPASPEQCFLHPDVIKSAAFDQINPELKKAREEIAQCDSDLSAYRAICNNEGDLRKSCTVSKCMLQPEAAKKIEDGNYFSESKALKESLAKKMGTTNVILASLIGGLKEKSKIDSVYPLYYQKDFLTNAIGELKDKMDKTGFKYDDAANIQASLRMELMSNKSYSKSFDSFQQKVLKNATKSQEKNLELVKEWAKAESLNESDLTADLAQQLTHYGKGSLFGR